MGDIYSYNEKQDKSLVDIGNLNSNKNIGNNFSNIMRDYMAELQNQSIKEDSLSKSGKKKSKKVTPKNVLANNQFSWM